MLTGQRSKTRRGALKSLAALAASAAVGSLGFPALVRAQSEAIKIGHLTPRTGFLGQAGEYGYRGALLAVEEANTAGGIIGRPIELVAEDSVNPATAATKAQKMLQRDQVVAIFGEISSASVLAISKEAARAKIPFFNSGGNSDDVRGRNCNRYLFHVEGNNTMYTKAIGTWLVERQLVKGKRWYALTADYSFGHDLFRASNSFLGQNGANNVGNDLIPTNTQDYSPYILKIRQAKPDFVYSCLAGIDLTNFLKQYKEYGLPYPVTGGATDTVWFWLAGADAISGYWQTMWYHGLNTPGSETFTKRFLAKYNMPPENCAWCDYTAARIILQSIAETKATDSAKIIQYLEKGATFDIFKTRKALFRDWDHQLMQEMYVVQIKDKSKMNDKWDIFDVIKSVPGPNEPLTAIQPTKEENLCKMAG